MPTPLTASRQGWLFCCATLIALALHGTAFGENPQPRISVRMWVIEAETEKLRNLGFEWSQLTSGGKLVSTPVSTLVTTPISTAGDIAIAISKADPNEFRGFLKALEQNNLARTLAEPTLVTLSGRKATLQIGQQDGQQTKLEVTPTVLDDQHVQLQYQMEVASESQASERTHLINGSTVQVEVGKLCFVSHTRSSSKSANGKRRETETLLLVQADCVTR